METFETILVLLFVATVLSRASKKVGVPYPTVLACVGALAAFIPGFHQLHLPPELILALFVAPVLLDAAYDTSLRDLKRSWIPLVSLVVVAVVLTTVAVALVARAFLPEIPWAAALTLGALLAPPDAVAAIAVLEHVNPPYRIRKVLEGESLLNDASALLIYKLSIFAAGAGGLTMSQAAPTLVLVLLGSVAAGLLMSWLASFLFDAIDDAATAIVLQFVVTFGVWLAADQFGLSAVITVVVFAVLQSRRSSHHLPALMRVSSFATWTAVVFVLNVLAFVIIGLQIRPILAGLEAGERVHYLLISGVILGVVIAVRFCWVMTHNITARMFYRFSPAREHKQPPAGPRVGIAIGWAGMRGIVTLAAAMALPDGFPYRDLMQVTAFAVVLGTLIIQGVSLGPLIKLLNLPEDNTVETEAAIGRAAALEAALKSVDSTPESPASRHLRREYSHLLKRVKSGASPRTRDDAELRLRSIAAAREALHRLRVDGTIGDDAFRIVEQELDWFELSIGPAA